MHILRGGGSSFHDLHFGPMVDAADGYTIETGLSTAAVNWYIQYGSNAPTQSMVDGTEVGSGWYKLQIGWGVNYGMYQVLFKPAGARPLVREFIWMEPNMYDGLISGTGISANVLKINSDATAAQNLEKAFDGQGYNVGGGQIVVNTVTYGVPLADGAITGSKFGEGVYPLSAPDQGETAVLRVGDGEHTFASISAQIDDALAILQRAHDALIETTNNDIVGTAEDLSHFARNSGYSDSDPFTETATLSVSTCGGYCQPGYKVALYLTLATPLTADLFPLSLVTLNMTAMSYTNGGNDFYVKLYNGLTPPLPATVSFGDIEEDCYNLSYVTIPVASGSDVSYGIDVTSLVNSLLEEMDPEDEVSNLLFVVGTQSGSSSANFHPIDGENDPQLVIGIPPTYSELPMTSADVLAVAYEESETLQDFLRLARAVLLGGAEVSGNEVAYRDVSGNLDRVIVAFDRQGNRSQVVTDTADYEEEEPPPPV